MIILSASYGPLSSKVSKMGKGRSGRFGSARGRDGEPDDHRGACAFAGAFGPDAAAVAFDDVATDEETKTEPGDVVREGVFGAAERFEDRFEVGGKEADAGVGDGQANRTVAGREG